MSILSPISLLKTFVSANYYEVAIRHKHHVYRHKMCAKKLELNIEFFSVIKMSILTTSKEKLKNSIIISYSRTRHITNYHTQNACSTFEVNRNFLLRTDEF